MKKVRILVEKWSNQDIIEMSDEAFEEFQEMSITEQEDYLEEHYPYIMTFDIVNIDITEQKG